MNDSLRDNVTDIFRGGGAPAGRGIEGGGGPPHDGEMEARVAKLEAAVEYIQRDVGELRQSVEKARDDISVLKTDVGVVKERLSHVPTKLEMWLAVGAVVLTVGGGLWWVVQTYLGPILAKAAG